VSQNDSPVYQFSLKSPEIITFNVVKNTGKAPCPVAVGALPTADA
jgi:hypothetical protein